MIPRSAMGWQAVLPGRAVWRGPAAPVHPSEDRRRRDRRAQDGPSLWSGGWLCVSWGDSISQVPRELQFVTLPFATLCPALEGSCAWAKPAAARPWLWLGNPAGISTRDELKVRELIPTDSPRACLGLTPGAFSTCLCPSGTRNCSLFRTPPERSVSLLLVLGPSLPLCFL